MKRTLCACLLAASFSCSIGYADGNLTMPQNSGVSPLTMDQFAGYSTKLMATPVVAYCSEGNPKMGEKINAGLTSLLEKIGTGQELFYRSIEARSPEEVTQLGRFKSEPVPEQLLEVLRTQAKQMPDSLKGLVAAKKLTKKDLCESFLKKWGEASADEFARKASEKYLEYARRAGKS